MTSEERLRAEMQAKKKAALEKAAKKSDTDIITKKLSGLAINQ